MSIGPEGSSSNFEEVDTVARHLYCSLLCLYLIVPFSADTPPASTRVNITAKDAEDLEVEFDWNDDEGWFFYIKGVIGCKVFTRINLSRNIGSIERQVYCGFPKFTVW